MKMRVVQRLGGASEDWCNYDWKGRSGWLRTMSSGRGSVQETIILLRCGFHYRKSESPHVQQIPFFLNGNFSAA